MTDPASDVERCDGAHTVRRLVVYATAEPPACGSVELEVCSDPRCARVVAARCEHQVCEWNAELTVLTCQLCGVDAT